MDRINISAHVPAEIAERRSDVGAEISSDDEQAIEAAADRSIKDTDWWNTELEGLNFSRAVAGCMASCMVNLSAAATGNTLAVNAILTALHNCRKTARLSANDEATEKYYAGTLGDGHV